MPKAPTEKRELTRRLESARSANLPGTKNRPSVNAVRPPSTGRGPLWDGPESDTPNGGVTQSLLGSFLCCRERFRIKVVEGLQPADSFRRALEFGNLWHCAEEAFAVSGNPIVDNPVAEPPWL